MTIKNFFENMFSGVHRIPACTDRQTEDRRMYILPRHIPRYAYASRVKTVKDTAIVTMENEKVLVCGLSNGAISNNLE